MRADTKSKRQSALLFAGTAAAAAAGTILYGVHGRSSQIFGRSVRHGDCTRRSIALTFDDGPNPGTLAVLDYLASQHVKATFFQCGLNVQRHPEITRAVHAAGHEIGNHTFSHPRLCPRLGFDLNLRSPNFIYQQLLRTQNLIHTETGVYPTLFRAPYGMRWFGLAGAQRRLGLTGVMWTVIGNDWKWPADRIAAHVLRHSSPGSIACLHDGRDIQPAPDLSPMLTALRHIVPALKAKGYTFETVSALLNRANALAHDDTSKFLPSVSSRKPILGRPPGEAASSLV